MGTMKKLLKFKGGQYMPECHIMTLGQHDRNSGSTSTGMVGQHEPESLFRIIQAYNFSCPVSFEYINCSLYCVNHNSPVVFRQSYLCLQENG